jgi:hypothetical protein
MDYTTVSEDASQEEGAASERQSTPVSSGGEEGKGKGKGKGKARE